MSGAIEGVFGGKNKGYVLGAVEEGRCAAPCFLGRCEGDSGLILRVGERGDFVVGEGQKYYEVEEFPS